MFTLTSKYKPAGDQPVAIERLVSGFRNKSKRQTLLGVTGSGKTFTAANVIAKLNKPTLVIAHNKTLAAQLCQEFRELFPQNAVHYFVSYYDYYQPEAYMPNSDTYIDKEAMINDEIDKLRHAATAALLTRKDVIIVASVSAIYGLGSPEEYKNVMLHFKLGDTIDRSVLMKKLIAMQFVRTNADLKRATFRLRGNNWEIMPADQELIYNFELINGVIDKINVIDPVKGFGHRKEVNEVYVFPAKHFITPGVARAKAIKLICAELKDRLKYFEKNGKLLEVERLERRTRYDLAMIKEMGYCHGIENYSRHLSGRETGEAPDTLLSYFPKDFLLVIDESHVTIPQLNGMYFGDYARKKTLIEFGFRLPSAADNRPLKFSEFNEKLNQVLYMSATPSEYEIRDSDVVVEQIIRPTGLVDPVVIVRPIMGHRLKVKGERLKNGDEDKSQIDDLIERIKISVVKKDRVLVTTLTKKMAEDLTQYLQEMKIKVNYIHSDVETLDRIRILSEFRKGVFDVLVGVNLLREGLDLPEVALVAILDADKEGFLRSDTSLIQTIGRAARNINGTVVLYADHMTGSLDRAIKETERRRNKQLEYNKKYGITPKTIQKNISNIIDELGLRKDKEVAEVLKLELSGLDKKYKTGVALQELIKDKTRAMKEAASKLDFELAAILRDEISLLKKNL